jgi:hypothetical protein
MVDVNFNELNVADLDNLIAEARAEKKARRENAKVIDKEAKEAIMAENKARLEALEAGAVISFTLKGEETEGTLDKVTEKRFIAIVDGLKKVIMFDKLIAC